MNLRIVTLSLALATGALLAAPASYADEPGRLNVIVARGEFREQIRATPILERPYRPFHFYGNAVRRAYYHGGNSAQVSNAVPSNAAAPTQQ
jgi:hypothetical protein